MVLPRLPIRRLTCGCAFPPLSSEAGQDRRLLPLAQQSFAGYSMTVAL